MNQALRQLIPTIVSFVMERGSFVTKTKLLKILYLFDIEWYRLHKTTYTGFDWVYHLLGPWSKDYDPALEILFANNDISRRRGGDNFDVEFITTEVQVYLYRVLTSADDRAAFEKVLNIWGNKKTAEILDYVYFRTEPMEQATRGARLDFTKVSDEPAPLYVRSRPAKSKEQIDSLRERIKEKLEQQRQVPKAPATFTPPKYDDEFFEAMDRLEALK